MGWFFGRRKVRVVYTTDPKMMEQLQTLMKSGEEQNKQIHDLKLKQVIGIFSTSKDTLPLLKLFFPPLFNRLSSTS
jgi:hypothetical protein